MDESSRRIVVVPTSTSLTPWSVTGVGNNLVAYGKTFRGDGIYRVGLDGDVRKIADTQPALGDKRKVLATGHTVVWSECNRLLAIHTDGGAVCVAAELAPGRTWELVEGNHNRVTARVVEWVAGKSGILFAEPRELRTISLPEVFQDDKLIGPVLRETASVHGPEDQLMDLDALGLPQGVRKKLENGGIFDTAGLLQRTEFELRKIRGIGDAAVTGIVAALAQHDLRLGAFKSGAG